MNTHTQRKYRTSIHLLLFLSIGLLFIQCHPNRKNPIPNIPFDITINLTLPSYIDLQNVGSYAFVEGGSKGIIVYRMSYDQFVAFDRHNPADASYECAQQLTPRADNFLELADTCSNARFSLLDGAAIEGSDVGLRQYMTVYDGGNNLRIYN
jgi:hypothetical protein